MCTDAARRSALCLLLTLAALSAGMQARAATEFSLSVDRHRTRVHGIVEGARAPPDAQLHRWIVRAVDALSGYLGRFPVPELYISVRVRSGAGIYSGKTFAADPPFINVELGASTSPAMFTADWVLIHEMAHLAVPSLPPAQRWFEEGFAGYVEAMARTRAGYRGERDTWAALHAGLAHGAPHDGEQGLDGTRRWGRLYWASLAFLLEGDIRDRRNAAGGRGLPALVSRWRLKSMDIRRRSSLAELVRIRHADGHLSAYHALYSEHGKRAGVWQPERLWQQLGLSDGSGGFAFYPVGEGAAVRRALTAP